MVRIMLVALSSLALLGCGKDCSPSNEAIITISEDADPSATGYASNPWTGPLTDFSAGVTLEFEHGLGETPQVVHTYISFTPDGTKDSEVTENAGNQGEIECVDSRVVRLHNGTCADFYVRLVALATGGGATDDFSCSR